MEWRLPGEGKGGKTGLIMVTDRDGDKVPVRSLTLPGTVATFRPPNADIPL
jgi:hypothetical protein